MATLPKLKLSFVLFVEILVFLEILGVVILSFRRLFEIDINDGDKMIIWYVTVLFFIAFNLLLLFSISKRFVDYHLKNVTRRYLLLKGLLIVYIIPCIIICYMLLTWINYFYSELFISFILSLMIYLGMLFSRRI
ncbi:MAG TPA: hypothetical protein VIM65_18710 [Cyclobacteriaceae bacterium]